MNYLVKKANSICFSWKEIDTKMKMNKLKKIQITNKNS